ncbi:MAG: hypothetical protein CVU11_02460 [Bacteroidetes bacterium HGW-Bacteroidetes-6]|jgi:hypothetical protein|nr:MAG: hypothetical protein CVU11_02460 [Bacteroidetes bacterium HGW-Bacteroidetes-6]
MKLIQLLTFAFLLLVSATVLFAQIEGYKCPWDEVDCPGKCGRFYDANADGFCDYGRLTAVVKPDTQKIIKPDTQVVHKVESANVNHVVQSSDTISKVDSAAVVDTAQTDVKPSNPGTSKPHTQRNYNLIWITLGVLLLYLITSILHHFEVIRKFVHRRIWNILLLLTFLTTAMLGLILVVQINYNLGTELILSYLYWHVQFGIAMAVITIIHILWHWKYFRNLFTSKSKHDCIN